MIPHQPAVCWAPRPGSRESVGELAAPPQLVLYLGQVVTGAVERGEVRVHLLVGGVVRSAALDCVNGLFKGCVARLPWQGRAKSATRNDRNFDCDVLERFTWSLESQGLRVSRGVRWDAFQTFRPKGEEPAKHKSSRARSSMSLGDFSLP